MYCGMEAQNLKKEILYRDTRRGIKELDIVFNRYIPNKLDSLSVEDLKSLAHIVRQTDLDLLDWLGKRQAPEHIDPVIFNQLVDELHRS